MFGHPSRDPESGAVSERGLIVPERPGWRRFYIRAILFMLLFWTAFVAFIRFSNFAMPALIAFFMLILFFAIRQQGPRAPSLRDMRLRSIRPHPHLTPDTRPIAKVEQAAVPLNADNDR